MLAHLTIPGRFDHLEFAGQWRLGHGYPWLWLFHSRSPGSGYPSAGRQFTQAMLSLVKAHGAAVADTT